ncbi:MAG TPA: helix-turn-helix domain-containing protein [Acidimicrobiales bacterium]|nr:helix-turn-helix domain-containing protein [Acidimicrobiales bacterium]
MPSALAALAFVVNGGHERPTLGASGANADDWLVPMVFTYDEVASLLRTSDRTVRRLVRAGDLPVIKVGGQPRVARADLDDYVARLRARRESELSNGPE